MRRFDGRDKANAALVEAQEQGDQEAIEKYSKRTVKVTQSKAEKKNSLVFAIPLVLGSDLLQAFCSRERKRMCD